MPTVTDRHDRRHDGVRPQARKRFGQHFLESVWAEKVVAAAAPAADDTFIEIGPGPGAITRPLAAHARAVAAFEIDRDMVQHLEVGRPENLLIVERDFLKVTAAEVVEALSRLGAPADRPVRVAGNLPYNVASPILFKLIELRQEGVRIADATVMLQREVADRLLSEPGTRDYGVLSVLIGHKGDVTRLLNLPPGAFRPPPKVRSTVVRIVFHPPMPPVRSDALFGALVQAVFTRRRKVLSNALLAHAGAASAGATRVLGLAGIDGQRRPETLSIEEFARLSDALSDLSGR
ncbi:MAG: 16S rRNA (adenine(1518)-N(6)/adenine(1519)-N(6))-dimethyltransferase RsmA [Vicinamibacterales bacterium]